MTSTLTLSEKLNLGLMTTGIGLLVVFCALILIIVVILVLSQILKERPKKSDKKEEVPVAEAAAPEPETKLKQQDDALTAVISAAVAAYLESENDNGLVVKSYRKVSAETPWAQAGRNAQIYNKL